MAGRLEPKKRPHFFKVFLPNCSSERLKIPIGFFKHMKGQTVGTAYLMGPSGNTWRVNLVEDMNGLFLEEGWPVFVKDHLIQVGDFVVFRYDGNLHFTVQIFTHSACEKEAAFFAKCSQEANGSRNNNQTKRGRKAAAEVLNASSYDAGLQRKKRGRKAAAEVLNASSYKAGLQRKKRGRKPAAEDLNVSSCKAFKGIRKRKRGMMFTRVKGKVTSDRLKKSKEVNDNNASSNKAGEGTRTINDKESNQLEMQRKWLEKLISWGGKGSEGHCQTQIFNESQYRVQKGTLKKKSENYYQRTVRATMRQKFSASSGREPKESLYLNGTTMRNSSKSRKELFVKEVKTGDVDLSTREKCTHSRVSLARRRFISEEDTKKIWKATETFTSNFPYFVKCVNSSNVSARCPVLHIPNWFSREHFSKCKRKAEIVIWNVKGKAWTMILVFYGSQFVFTGGWAAFAHGNKLQEGDTCIFELVGKTEMRVHILRVVKKVKFVADESV